MIWGKTYPELSSHHTETACAGAISEDGAPIRLYPVPLRYLDSGKQYHLYDWIEVPAERGKSDPRPESYRVSSEGLRRLGNVSTENGSWRTRRDLIFRSPAWHFESVGALKRAEAESKRSMGLVTPGTIDGVRLIKKSASDRREYDKKLAAIQSQADIFRAESAFRWGMQDCYRCDGTAAPSNCLT